MSLLRSPILAVQRPPDAIRDAIARTPGLAAALHRVLDAVEKKGRLPRTLTLGVEPGVGAGLAEVLSRRGVTELPGGRVRLGIATSRRIRTTVVASPSARRGEGVGQGRVGASLVGQDETVDEGQRGSCYVSPPEGMPWGG